MTQASQKDKVESQQDLDKPIGGRFMFCQSCNDYKMCTLGRKQYVCVECGVVHYFVLKGAICK